MLVLLDHMDTIEDAGTPAFKATSEAAVAESEVATKLRRRIVRIPAHTWAGIQLKIDVAAWCVEPDSGGADEEFAEVLRRDTHAANEAVFWSLTRDLAAWRPTDDAGLLELGLRFEAARQAEAAAWAAFGEAGDLALKGRWDVAFAEANGLVDQIVTLPATTLPGLVVKARACSRSRAGEATDLDDEGATDKRLGAISALRDMIDEATSDRLAAAILRDLLKLDGRPLPEQGCEDPDEDVPMMAAEAERVPA